MAARQDEDELRPSKSTKEAKRTSRMEIDRGKLPIRPGSYVHLCILQLRTPNGLEEDVSNEFAEITCISWTLVDLLEKEIVLSEEVEIPLSQVEGPNGVVYKHITGETFTTAVNMVVQTVKEQTKSCCLVCEGPLPLRHYLHRKARQKDEELDPFFFKYFDLFVEFKQTFPKTPGSTLEEMSKSLNIPDMEPEKMFAAVLLCLDRMGHIFINPEVIQHRWDYPPMELPIMKSILNSVTIGVHGVDYNMQYSDLLDYFAGLNVVPGGLLICINKSGIRTGKASVIFETKLQSNLALLRNNFHIKSHGRYLKLWRSSIHDYVHQVYGSCRPMTSSPTVRRSVCRFKYLPSGVSTEQICQWIRPICKLPGGNHGVLPLQTPQGKLINEVLVVFKSQGFMYDFLQKGNPKFKGQEVIGQPLILTELVMLIRKTVKHLDMYHFLEEVFELSLERVLLRFPFRDEKNVLHIIGFPQHFTGKDILLQFGHLGDEIQRQGVRTVLKRGHFTGECYVHMRTAIAAFLASQKLMKEKKCTKVVRMEKELVI